MIDGLACYHSSTLTGWVVTLARPSRGEASILFALTRERTLAGLRSARARGRAGGRPKKLPRKEDLDMLRTLVREGNTPVKDIAARFGISRATVYRLASANGKT